MKRNFFGNFQYTVDFVLRNPRILDNFWISLKCKILNFYNSCCSAFYNIKTSQIEYEYSILKVIFLDSTSSFILEESRRDSLLFKFWGVIFPQQFSA